MINYSDKGNVLKMIELETISLESTLDIQKNINKQLLTFMKNYIGNIEIDLDFSPKNKTLYFINKSSACLTKSNTNIKNLRLLLNVLNKIKTLIDQTPNSSKIKPAIEKYNNKFSTSIESIYKNTSIIQKFLFETSTLTLMPIAKSSNNNINIKNEKKLISNKKKKNDNDDSSIPIVTSKELELSYLENTLVISDINGKVILPYKLETVKEILLDDSSYTSLEDVISKLYTLPMTLYKSPAIARFREAYNLVIKKSNGSRLKALSLAYELFFNYNLHPAVITACKNLDELDIYLACLEDGELDKFKFFDIKYEIAPVVSAPKKSYD